MNWFLYIIMHLIFCFVAGTIFGYQLHKKRVAIERENNHDERETYCHGFEDGIYFTIGEYQPELYRVEIAEMCYKEYKAIKHGPQKH